MKANKRKKQNPQQNTRNSKEAKTLQKCQLPQHRNTGKKKAQKYELSPT